MYSRARDHVRVRDHVRDHVRDRIRDCVRDRVRVRDRDRDRIYECDYARPWIACRIELPGLEQPCNVSLNVYLYAIV